VCEFVVERSGVIAMCLRVAEIAMMHVP